MKSVGNRKSTRLRGYDYSADGVYFVTFCVTDRHEMLSEVVVGAGSTRPWVELLPHGIVVETAVSHIPDKYSHVAIDKYVIMPNHVHFIMSIQGRVDPAPTLGQIVAYLKYQTAKTAETRELWQRGFYDRIIRNSDEYRRIWQYIDNNPATWREDRYYVNRADASHV